MALLSILHAHGGKSEPRTQGAQQLIGGADVPRGTPEWATDNPTWAARDFAAKHPEFVIEQPAWPFNESELEQNITHWPEAWLKRV